MIRVNSGLVAYSSGKRNQENGRESRLLGGLVGLLSSVSLAYKYWETRVFWEI
jgi:hypothetical protein